MKKLIITLAFLLVAGLGNTNAQQQQVKTEPNKKIITHLAGDLYNVVFLTSEGDVFQEGKYLSVDEHLVPHGVWKLYDRSTFDLLTTAKYDKGEQIWIETIVDGEIIRVNKMDLKVKRLQERIAKLEKQLKDKDGN